MSVTQINKTGSLGSQKLMLLNNRNGRQKPIQKCRCSCDQYEDSENKERKGKAHNTNRSACGWKPLVMRRKQDDGALYQHTEHAGEILSAP